jgi:Xaa-Pro aminopeptidase
MDHKGRRHRLRQVLASNRLDALLIAHLPNIFYLCGFSGSAGAMVLTEPASMFFTDGRYTSQARAEVQGAKTVIGKKGPLAAAADWLSRHISKGARSYRLGIEAEHLTVAARTRLAASLPSKVRLREAPELVERARMVKDAQEIKRIRAAVLLGAGLFDVALAVIRPGLKETEVAAEMEFAARKRGATAMSFSTIIASGRRSALPHGRASTTPVADRGFVVCDFGVILSDYCSDMTRTVHVGQASPAERSAYQAVKDAQQAAVDAVKPGISVGEVDRAARKSLQNSGLGKYFTHSTGHGVGLEIHEGPRVAAGQTEVLRPGMVITIEPGVYVPGRFGVRIEDMVVVTEQGCEVLTPASASKELIEI